MGGGGGGGGDCGDLPNVVNAVELTPNNTMKMANSMVRLPHCVNLLSGSIFVLFIPFCFLCVGVRLKVFSCFLYSFNESH